MYVPIFPYFLFVLHTRLYLKILEFFTFDPQVPTPHFVPSETTHRVENQTVFSFTASKGDD